MALCLDSRLHNCIHILCSSGGRQWDCSGFSEADKNWLETNCVAVHIAHRVWKSAPTAPASAATSKRVWRSPQKQGDAEGRDWAAPMDED